MVLSRIAGTITVVRIWIYAISAVKRFLPGWMMPWHLWKVLDMLTQIENTPDGYIVGIFLRDGTGCGRWYRLRNFGDRQGDAIEFREWDLPTFTDAQIRLCIKTFKIENKYKRLDKNKYAKVQIFQPGIGR